MKGLCPLIIKNQHFNQIMLIEIIKKLLNLFMKLLIQVFSILKPKKIKFKQKVDYLVISKNKNNKINLFRVRINLFRIKIQTKNRQK